MARSQEPVVYAHTVSDGRNAEAEAQRTVPERGDGSRDAGKAYRLCVIAESVEITFVPDHDQHISFFDAVMGRRGEIKGILLL